MKIFEEKQERPERPSKQIAFIRMKRLPTWVPRVVVRED